MTKASRVIVLTEDESHQSFADQFLKRLGYGRHQIFLERVPNGAGSGEKWVRDNYSRAVEAYRRRSAKAATALLVVIDADDQEPVRRQRQLEAELDVARTEDERITHLIPKRNIETWILCLDGNPVNEVDDYSKAHGIEDRIGPAARAFFDWTRPNAIVPSHCIPSIYGAIPEAQKLET
jgi:hypothetical protein